MRLVRRTGDICRYSKGRMMSETSPSATVHLTGLREWMVKLLVKQGLFAAEAEITALRLIESELIGRSAGGLRWLPRLLSAMDVGDIDPRARLVTIADLPALTVIDGSTGVGQVALTHILQLAMKKAQAAGSAMAVVKNSRPVGDPTACLAAATSAGCVAGIMTTCKRQAEPWPIGPCSVWGWPGPDSPLMTSAASPLTQADLFADVLAAGLGGNKSSAAKKRLFADDAEYVCIVTDISQCTARNHFQQVAQQAIGSDGLTAPAWIFDVMQWPETAAIAADVVAELRELAATSRVVADW